MKPPLLTFKCNCGYTEDIGVGIRSGVIIKGDVSLICPKCGAIFNIAAALLMSPVEFYPPTRSGSTGPGRIE